MSLHWRPYKVLKTPEEQKPIKVFGKYEEKNQKILEKCGNKTSQFRIPSIDPKRCYNLPNHSG